MPPAEKLQKKNCLIVDATCPLVVANQKKAASYAKEGYQVILAGDKNHGEVVGIAGFAEYEKSGSCFLVENETDALKLIENSSENQIDINEGKLVFLCQTTFSSKELKLKKMRLLITLTFLYFNLQLFFSHQILILFII